VRQPLSDLELSGAALLRILQGCGFSSPRSSFPDIRFQSGTSSRAANSTGKETRTLHKIGEECGRVPHPCVFCKGAGFLAVSLLSPIFDSDPAFLRARRIQAGWSSFQIKIPMWPDPRHVKIREFLEFSVLATGIQYSGKD
jgi:hypothetical protein